MQWTAAVHKHSTPDSRVTFDWGSEVAYSSPKGIGWNVGAGSLRVSLKKKSPILKLCKIFFKMTVCVGTLYLVWLEFNCHHVTVGEIDVPRFLPLQSEIVTISAKGQTTNVTHQAEVNLIQCTQLINILYLEFLRVLQSNVSDFVFDLFGKWREAQNWSAASETRPDIAGQLRATKHFKFSKRTWWNRFDIKSRDETAKSQTVFFLFVCSLFGIPFDTRGKKRSLVWSYSWASSRMFFIFHVCTGKKSSTNVNTNNCGGLVQTLFIPFFPNPTFLQRYIRRVLFPPPPIT